MSTTILIVDDHKLIRDTWQYIIESREGFEIVGSTGDGIEAIRLARELKPRIILMDINMTPKNGFELAKEIFGFSPLQFIIGVSMHAQSAIAKKFIATGGRGYVTKNSPAEEMMNAIVDVNNGKRYISMDIRQYLMADEQNKTRDNILSSRELEIVNGIRKGLTSAEIASLLGMSRRTAETHRYNIFKKLQVKNSVSLVQAVMEMGL